MGPYKRLGLETNADETAIKRAYARLLKLTRPDDDPQGFQQLNEAYQAALAHARQPPEWHDAECDIETDEDAPDDEAAAYQAANGPALAEPDTRDLAIPPAATLTAEDVAHVETPGAEAGDDNTSEPGFDFEHFYAQVLQQAVQTDGEGLLRWLAGLDDLYHIGLKRAVGSTLFARIEYDPAAVIPPSQITVLCDFFGIDENFWWQQRMSVRWAIAHEDTAEYGEPHPRALRELRKPFQRWRALLLGCVPGMSKRISQLGERLSHDYGELPDAIDQEQLQFHRRLADVAYFGRDRWLQLLLRATTAAVLAYLAMAYLVAVKLRPLESLVGLPRALIAPASAAAAMLVLLLAWQGFSRLYAFSQGQADGATAWKTLMPLWLALGALLVDATLSKVTGGLPYVLAVTAAAMHWRRTFDAIRFLLGGYLMYSVLEASLGALSQGVVALAMVPIGIATFDGIYARNHDISIAAAVGNRWTDIASYAFFLAWLLQSWTHR